MKPINDYAKAELKRLRASGINPTDEEIYWLATLGEKITNPNRRTLNPLEAGAPVVAGCEVLWPLTNQASWWLDIVTGWFEGINDLYAVAFAMAKGREHGAFDSYTVKDSAVDAVKEWAQKLTCTPGELAKAVNILLDNDSPERDLDENDPVDFMNTLAELEVATHQPKETWMIRTPTEASQAMRAVYRFAMISAGVSADEATKDTREAIRNVMIAANQIKEGRTDG